MVNRINTNVVSEFDKLNETEASAVLDYISTLLTKRTAKSRENPSNDDLIVSLSDAYENKRARQVVEWERVRRQNVQRAA
ncbi:MAG: hypothetical protein JWN60_1139 [Acidobacteria bacterium]|jgi:hypothetical protein|nr:hypothetical protein [Acidobacteriota bacterium]